MRRPGEALRWIGVAWLLAAIMALPIAAEEAKRDLIWGVNGHPLVSYPGVSIERQLDYVKELGMTSYRIDVVRTGQASGLAALVRAGKARGIEILPVLAPALNLDEEKADDLYIKARGFAVSLVSRFKDDIRVWELGNELENYAIIRACEMQDDGAQYNCKWGPAGGVGVLEYYGPRWKKVSAVLKGLSDGVTAVDPTIRKAMGTAGWGHTGAFARMHQDGIKWDISVWHMYGQDPEWAFKVLAGFNHPIWVTEFNHPGGGRESAQQQADGIVRAMTRLRQLRKAYNVEAAHIYELMDETYWAPGAEAFMGLIALVEDGQGGWKPGERKPAFVAAKSQVADSGAWAGRDSDCYLNPHNRLSSAASMQISYAYCLVLERAVDGAGFKGWMAALQKDTAAPELLLAMLGSAEFNSKHTARDLSNAEFVRLLYRLLLNRERDDAEAVRLVPRLDTGSLTRGRLAAAIVDSAEFRARHPILFPSANDHGP
jgi:hypothetical protein